MRIRGFVRGGRGADVGDPCDACIGIEVGFDGFFVRYAGILVGDSISMMMADGGGTTEKE